MLKYREKDDLETAFKNYGRGVPFDVDTLRDHRLRGNNVAHLITIRATLDLG